MTPFEDMVELEGLEPDEQERLRRVHELLLEAGPPPELPAALAKLPHEAGGARVLAFPTARRRVAVALAFAAAIAAAAFGGGYAVGHHGGDGGAVRVIAMNGRNALGSLSVEAPDVNGNWPISFQANGLLPLKGDHAYYELFVLKNGKPAFPCGGFRVQANGTTQVYFTVPYRIQNSTKWVLTAIDATDHWPGRVVMT